MLVGSNPKQAIELNEDSFLIIQKESWTLYEVLASEDLRVEYIKERIYIQSPASYIHEDLSESFGEDKRTYFVQKTGKSDRPKVPNRIGGFSSSRT